MIGLLIKIFIIRIIDVSMGTVRTLFVVKGHKIIAAMIGFVEALIWFLIIREALTMQENNIFVSIVYAGGFAFGTYIGSILASKFIQGKVSIQVFTSSADQSVVDQIRKHGYAVSVIECKGIKENEHKFMLFISVDKKKVRGLRSLIKSIDEGAFIVVNEAVFVENGYFK